MSGQGRDSSMNAAMTTRNPQRLAALCALWQEAERDVWLTLQGESMMPTILPGARLCVRCQGRDLPLGTIIAFRRGRSLVVHRLKAVAWTDTGEQRLICQGDGNLHTDEPIAPEDVVGVVVAIRAPHAAARASLAVRRVLRPWRARWRGSTC